MTAATTAVDDRGRTVGRAGPATAARRVAGRRTSVQPCRKRARWPPAVQRRGRSRLRRPSKLIYRVTAVLLLICVASLHRSAASTSASSSTAATASSSPRRTPQPAEVQADRRARRAPTVQTTPQMVGGGSTRSLRQAGAADRRPADRGQERRRQAADVRAEQVTVQAVSAPGAVTSPQGADRAWWSSWSRSCIFIAIRFSGRWRSARSRPCSTTWC